MTASDTTPAERTLADRIPILCFHAVSADPNGSLAPWVMTVERFDEHLDALDASGYRPISIGDLVTAVHDDGRPPPAGALALTFDDGYADMAEVVWPRLAARGWPATLYVTTGVSGSTFHDRPMLDRHQVAVLAADGLEIGAHGHRHLQVDAVDPAIARDEIQRSRDLLQDWTGQAVGTFAYPHGYHDRRTRDLVVTAGFQSACAVKQALSSTRDDRFALARLMPTGDLSSVELVDRLQAARTRVATGQRERPVTTAWRYVRRARARWAA